MALVLLSFFTGVLCGFVGGVLVVRNNKAKAEALDQKASDLLKK